MEPSGQSKIANLELAIGIDQQVPWLQITMNHIGRVDVLPGCQLDSKSGLGLLWKLTFIPLSS